MASAQFSQLVRLTMRGERYDAKARGMPRDHIQGTGADGTGCSEYRDVLNRVTS